MFSVYVPVHSMPTPVHPSWSSPGGYVRLEHVRYKDATLAGVEAVVLVYCHGSSRLYRLPETRSALLRATRIPASTPTGRLMRDWLDALLQPRTPDEPEVDPIASTKTII